MYKKEVYLRIMRMVKFIKGYIGLTPGKVYEVIKHIPGTELPSNTDVISIFNDDDNLKQYYMKSIEDNSITYFEDYTIGYRDDIIDGILT